MMPRLFFDRDAAGQQHLTIDGEQGHHFARVLRVRPGEQAAMVFNGSAYLAEVESVDSKAGTVAVRILQSLPPHEPAVRVYLVQGLAKGDKVEDILQRCTEVGVAGVLVCATARSVVQLDERKAAAKIDRWRRIAAEAASQSQRDVIPSVDFAGTGSQMKQWLERLQPDLLLLLDEDETATGLKHALHNPGVRQAGRAGRPPVIAIAVGPEGGWDETERMRFRDEFQAVSVSLGPRILRTQTAGQTALSAILYEYGELGGESGCRP